MESAAYRWWTPLAKLIGVISEGDSPEGTWPARTTPVRLIASSVAATTTAEDRRLTAQTAGQAMSAPPVTIDADRPIREAAAVMIDRAINRLPVMSSGRLVGIVTRADLVRAYLRRDDETLRTIRDEVLHDTMWIDPDDLQVEVKDGHVRLEGVVDRRSTATILEKLIGLVDGVDRVDSHLRWRLRRHQARSTRRRPGAGRGITGRARASPVTARLMPRPSPRVSGPNGTR